LGDNKVLRILRNRLMASGSCPYVEGQLSLQVGFCACIILCIQQTPRDTTPPSLNDTSDNLTWRN
jgi:hypothetical protein